MPETQTQPPRRRGKKPAAATMDNSDVEDKEQASTDEVETRSPEIEERDYRIIEKGSAIEVKTDDYGVAQETVLQEINLPGTDQVSYIQIAAKGAFYQK